MKIKKVGILINPTICVDDNKKNFIKSGVYLEAEIEDSDKTLEAVREKLHRLTKLMYIRNIQEELRWMKEMAFKSPDEWVKDQLRIATQLNNKATEK